MPGRQDADGAAGDLAGNRSRCVIRSPIQQEPRLFVSSTLTAKPGAARAGATFGLDLFVHRDVPRP
jgi:hypothetical protein